jgi:hypothetical protein
MSVNNFLKKDNVSLLWDVLIDDDIMKNKQPNEISHINDVFNTNLKKFYDASNSKKNLTELNKNYITVMMKFIINNFQQQSAPILKKKGLVTYEEIQNDRLSQFEKDYTSRQQEFTSAMSLPVPKTPDFSDKIDGPLGEMDDEVKRYLAQRNYDVEQINKIYDNKDTADKWLKSQETSLKAEKIQPVKNVVTSTPIKYIKIDKSTNLNESVINKDVIDLSTKKKSITWAENLEECENLEKQNDSVINVADIFSKLKTIPTIINQNQNQNQNEDITFLKNEINILHKKLDTILDLLNVKN